MTLLPISMSSAISCFYVCLWLLISSCNGQCSESFPTVLYNGNCYATVGGVDPADTTVACESTGYSMPAGWMVAEDNADSDAVGALYPWGTHIVVYGYPLNQAVGCESTTTYSSACDNDGRYVKFVGGLYWSSFCQGRVLIIKDPNATPNPTANPTAMTAMPSMNPTSNPLPDQSRLCDGLGIPFPTIHYNGFCYATIGGVDPDSTSVGCENIGYSMPAGWGLADNSADSDTVATSYPWGTHILVYGTANVHSGCEASTLYGSCSNSNWLVNYDAATGLYKTPYCSLRILIKRAVVLTPFPTANPTAVTAEPTKNPSANPVPAPTSNPTMPTTNPTPSICDTLNVPFPTVTYNGKCYATIGGVDPDSTSVGCENAGYSMPDGWTLAANSIDSDNVANAYPWGTHILVYGTANVHSGCEASSIYGSCTNSNWLVNYDPATGLYKTPYCSLRVLIQYDPDATSQPSVNPTTVTADPTKTPTTNPVPAPTSNPTAPTANPTMDICDTLGIPFPTVSYNGYCYGTIGGVDPDETTIGCERDTWYSMPDGFSLAPDSVDSDTVANSYPWGTHILVYGTANVYSGCEASTLYGSCSNSGWYVREQSGTYSTTNCHLRVLIKKPDGTLNPTTVTSEPTMIPTAYPTTNNPTEDPTICDLLGVQFPTVLYNGNCYATIGGVDPEDTTIGCERDSWYSMPDGWTLAPDSADSDNVASSYPWGTHILVYGTANVHSGCEASTLYGSCTSSGWYVKEQSGLYATTNCHLRVLIKYDPDATSQPTVNPITSNPTTNPVPAPTSNPVVPTNCDLLGEPFPTVGYNGKCYATIGGVDPDSTTIGCERDTWYSMPDGWILATNSIDSDTVANSYPWGTHVLVYGTANVHSGCSPSTLYGSCSSGWYVREQSGTYSTNVCSLRVLIQYDADATSNPTVNPTAVTIAPTSQPSVPSICGESFPTVGYNGYCYATIGGVDPDDTNIGCERDTWYSMPNGWSLADDSADSDTVASSYPWGTHILVYGTANVYSGCEASTLYGSCSNSGWYVREQSGTYSTTNCHLRVLIKKRATTSAPSSNPSMEPTSEPTMEPTTSTTTTTTTTTSPTTAIATTEVAIEEPDVIISTAEPVYNTTSGGDDVVDDAKGLNVFWAFLVSILLSIFCYA